MNIVITGASRGIGRELVRVALRIGHRVVAVSRQPGQVLPEAAADAARLRVVLADVADESAAASIAAAAAHMGAVDLLVNNAGLMLGTADRAGFLRSFVVNSIAPFEITRALLPALRQSAAPKVVHVSSKMGSIGDNTSGGHYEYRASKAALNMISRSLALDNDWLVSLVVHPGWVRTDMGGAGRR